MKTQISTSVSPRTRRQADELMARFGTMNAVLTVAIDRLWHAEQNENDIDESSPTIRESDD